MGAVDATMRAMVFESFGELPRVVEVPRPRAPEGGVVVRVEATGLCRSDWHAWQGHDPDITTLPHVPGHELAGTVHEVGPGVATLRVGQRVVAPFVLGCGTCRLCRAGQAQVCPQQWQPGFSGPGSFAGYVALPAADFNLVPLPDEVTMEVAAGLGCRFATAYRGVVDVAKVQEGDTVAVLGCGGVGLAAVMIAASRGAQVVAVDVAAGALELARSIGAAATVDASVGDPVAAIRELHPDGVDVSIDALGSVATADAGVRSLRAQGRHVQIGLLPPAVVGDRATVPMHVVIGQELQVLGSHGMAAADYPRMLSDIAAGRLDPGRFLARTIPLEEAPAALAAMDGPGAVPGVTIIRP